MNNTTMHKQFFASSPKKKNRFHVAVGLSLNISDTLGSPLCASFFCSYQILMSSVISYRTDVQQHGMITTSTTQLKRHFLYLN